MLPVGRRWYEWFVFLCSHRATYNNAFLPYFSSPHPLFTLTIHLYPVPFLTPPLQLYKQRMLIAHVIGGVIFFASFLLRTPQPSSTLSLLLTVFKSVAPVSLIQRIEDVFTIPHPSVYSPSFHSDLIFSPNHTITDLVVYYPPLQFSDLGSKVKTNRSAESVAREVSQEEYFPSWEGVEEEFVPNSAGTDPHVLLLFIPPCVILVLCLTYVSRLRAHP